MPRLVRHVRQARSRARSVRARAFSATLAPTPPATATSTAPQRNQASMLTLRLVVRQVNRRSTFLFDALVADLLACSASRGNSICGWRLGVHERACRCSAVFSGVLGDAVRQASTRWRTPHRCPCVLRVSTDRHRSSQARHALAAAQVRGAWLVVC